MNKLKKYIKPLLGLFLFYGMQYGASYLFYDILIKENKTINQAIYLASELLLFAVMFYMNRKALKEDYNDFNSNYKEYLTKGFKYAIMGVFCMMISNLIISGLMTGGIAENEENNRLILQAYPIYMIVATILTGPFIEEMTFRQNFKEAIPNQYAYVGITAFLFAMAHVVTSLDTPYGYLYLIPYGSLSLAFSLASMRTNNIYTSVILHIVHNTLTMMILITLG